MEYFTKDFLQTSLAELAFLEIVLAICQADFEGQSQCQDPTIPSQAVLEHHSSGLQSLQSRLSSTFNPKNEAILATVLA